MTSIEMARARLSALSTDPRVTALCAALGRDVPLYLVGGCVRDAILGISAIDLDCATPLLPDDVRIRLEQAGIHVVPTGLKHQTVTAVPIAGGGGIEVTTFRGPNMRPEGGVSSSSTIEEDVRYRDFTVNALAYDIIGGTIIDAVGSLEDLEYRVIRAVGDPAARFAEDPLRVLRMARFASIPGFTVDAATRSVAARFVPRLAAVSIERIREEISRTAISGSPATGLRIMGELGVFALLIPELEACRGFEQNDYHVDDVFEHTLKVVEKTPPDLVLRLGALLHDIGKPPTLTVDSEDGARHFFKHEVVGAEMTRELLERLRYSTAITRDVTTLVATHMRTIEGGAGSIRRLLRDTEDLFPAWRILKEADATSCRMDPEQLQVQLAAFDAQVEIVKQGPPVSPLRSLAINGGDLLALGIPQSPRIGILLRALHERVLDDPTLNTRERLLELLPEVERNLTR